MSSRGARGLARVLTASLLAACLGLAACVQGQPATDTGDPGSPFGPTPIDNRPLAYMQDIKPVFDRDCLECHNARDAQGDYSVATYSDVMNNQRPGDAKSSLVRDCSPGGKMYRYFSSSDALTDATMVFRWMVVDGGAEIR